MKKSVDKLHFPIKGKYVAMLAPSFIVDFDYPDIIGQLRQLGFDKVVELTFGAKMINREYHNILKKLKKLWIASPCPAIVEFIKTHYPKYVKNLMPVDSPMVATSKICKKVYPKHKVVFISPCYAKKKEAELVSTIDCVIDYNELRELFCKFKIKKSKKKFLFDKFYNDYTKIFPLSGGLGKTAHLKGVLKKNEIFTAEGVKDISKFFKKPNKKIRLMDVLFCKGGCIGGPCVASNLSIASRKKKVLKYLERSQCEDIPETKKGLVKKAEGVGFRKEY